MAGERPSEDGLIARYFAPLAGSGADGLRDDAATLTPREGYDLVVTTDTVVAGIHYLPDDAGASVARKAMGVNLSDLAAKGATPCGFVVNLGLPEAWTEAWLADFAAGLGRAIAQFGCPLLGGDTVRTTGPAFVGVTALGEVPAGAMVRRMTARIGDRLCVTGTIGDAALGLPLARGERPAWAAGLDGGSVATLVDRYRHPRPRLALAPALRRHARAAMDVSDGLAGDLAKMLVGEGRCAVVAMADVPLSPAARAAVVRDPRLHDLAVTGGDDYEILSAVPPDALTAFLADARAADVAMAVIGTVTAGEGRPLFLFPDGSQRRFATGSFSHF
ncbi:thiamine-phosphate kinase [Methylobacterium sp. Leaf108]|uniref:thiamine-phosphate kinase n=1 Tax=Methylobacterium sp. Leaf108 TaxID=1736256 RepID=UPI0006F92906|nr:thiamine-phosphate kinase [Methylobacterium sp. Leaf108]KQP51678.1 thiamine-monophosphate kinase [Methylobacterium sp. Leaf108]